MSARVFLSAALALCLGTGSLLAEAGQRRPNHLIREKSPYLLQHAYNPVDWYPWGEEAFAKARRENKPIFLSIGYSTCHWCHVMERESYSNARVAAALNADFVSIKVDREERPDVDNVYMTAAQAAGWGGGWPLNLWLTPDLKPIFGGTYFPPDSRGGPTGLIEISDKIASLWKNHEGEVRAGAGEIVGALRKYAQADAGSGPLSAALMDGGYETLLSGYDAAFGGFGRMMKFPMPANQDFLLRYYARTKEKKALDMVVGTLRAMADGGIHDQLGGGFHRYSTDRQWRVPHFEKMLYDNAQLAVNYTEAYQATKAPEFAGVARDILRYVRRDMTAPEGGFYSAEDADSLPPGAPADGALREGAFYLWRKADIFAALGPGVGEIFCARYGVEPGGNIGRDPQGEFGGLNILYAAQSATGTAREFHKPEDETRQILEDARRKLLAARQGRRRPLRDDKVVTSWNGLMISAFAKAASTFDDDHDLQAAEGAARFVRTRLYDAKTGRLYRYWRDGERRGAGLADDYAFLVQGLLDLYEASFDANWLEWAVRLTETQQAL
ncbi:MAG: thioredoxin domain-containing protein, partial [Elusimicrobia bacterium]|nr:thioredoxin domain-containing protein [Elusimicrobiota bacterium]